MPDVLNDIFRMIRLKACVYFQRDLYAPWSVKMPNAHMAQFHIVVRGVCYAEWGATSRELSPGDILMFPHGEVHTLADAPDRTPLPAEEAMDAFSKPPSSGPVRATRLICGHYEYRLKPSHPLIDSLPTAIHIPSRNTTADQAALSALPLLIEETRGSDPGGEALTERLAEALLIQALRIYYANEPQVAGFMAGVMDGRISRALQMIHQEYERQLTLADLAADAGLSRSALAEHFKLKTGLAPIEYLTKWRMLIASDQLENTDLPVGRIALNTGYESDVAFTRAFKREFGQSPAQLRRGLEAGARN